MIEEYATPEIEILPLDEILTALNSGDLGEDEMEPTDPFDW